MIGMRELLTRQDPGPQGQLADMEVSWPILFFFHKSAREQLGLLGSRHSCVTSRMCDLVMRGLMLLISHGLVLTTTAEHFGQQGRKLCSVAETNFGNGINSSRTPFEDWFVSQSVCGSDRQALSFSMHFITKNKNAISLCSICTPDRGFPEPCLPPLTYVRQLN